MRVLSRELSLVVIVASLLACSTKATPGSSDGGDGGLADGGDAGIGQATIGGTVTDYLGYPVSGVAVSGGGATATTASDGTYTLSNVVVPTSGSAVVDLTSPGYLDSALSVAVATGQTSELYAVVMPASPSQPLDATAGGTVTGVRGASLTAGPRVFVDQSGNAVTGTVQVALTALTPGASGLIDAYPGNLSAVDSSGNPAVLQTYGVLDVTVTQNGQKLQIASGQTVTVVIPAALVGPLPPTSGLWSFNLNTALWVEEGTATLSGQGYTAQLPHLSQWNVDCSWNTGMVCMQGTLMRCDGTPIIGAQITVESDTASYHTLTGGSSEFCVVLPPAGGMSGTMSANDACYLGVYANKWDFHVRAGNFDARAEVAAPTQATASVPRGMLPACILAQHEGGCLSLGNLGCLGGDGGVVTLHPTSPDAGASACPYWQDAGASATDGGASDGGAFVDPFAGTCAEDLVTLFSCFNGSGACTLTGDLGDAGPVNLSYANGSVETLTSAGMSENIAYYGPDGGLCGTATTSAASNTSTFAIGSAVLSITTADGTTTLVCPDGGVVTLSMDQTNAATNCGGGGGVSACKVPGAVGTPCTTNAQCGGLEQTSCCTPLSSSAPSLCLTDGADAGPDGSPADAGLCKEYIVNGCATDADCVGGDTCCAEPELGFSLCGPAASCVSTGCGATNPCPNGGLCCMVAGVSFCEPAGGTCPQSSTCTSSAQCGSADVCCPAGGGVSVCEPAVNGACP